MEAVESVKIIEQMLNESKKSLAKNSFFFLLWAAMMVPAGIAEYFLYGTSYFWMIWPIAGGLGGIISFIYGMQMGKKLQYTTAAGRIYKYTWGAFGFCMIFVIAYAVNLKQPPHALILMLAGGATFISGGISNFKPFVYGAVALLVSAVICAFVVEPPIHSLVFAAGMFTGYLIPGLILRKLENG